MRPHGCSSGTGTASRLLPSPALLWGVASGSQSPAKQAAVTRRELPAGHLTALRAVCRSKLIHRPDTADLCGQGQFSEKPQKPQWSHAGLWGLPHQWDYQNIDPRYLNK